MDIKKIIEDTLEKLQKDESLQELFLKDPVAAVEKITGLDLPEDQMNGIVTGIKAKLTADNIGGAIKGLGGLFGKK